MAKWQKPKDSKALAERKIYSQIKRAEKIPASKELSKDQEHLKYCFAMHCHNSGMKRLPLVFLGPTSFKRNGVRAFLNTVNLYDSARRKSV